MFFAVINWFKSTIHIMTFSDIFSNVPFSEGSKSIKAVLYTDF